VTHRERQPPAPLVRGLLLALAVAGCGSPRGALPGRADGAGQEIDAEIRRFLDERSLPGLSVAILRGSEAALVAGYGWADVERRHAVTARTLFPIGSVEKQFTAAAILRLVERGRLRLDDPITRFIPRLDTAGATITIADMLHQVSGLQEASTLAARRRQGPAPDPAPGEWGPVPAASVGEGFDSADIGAFQGQPLYFPPGQRFSYSQPNYDLLCYVIAERTGTTYYQAIAEVARAAGLARFHAAWQPRPASDDPDVAHGYRRDGEGFEEVWEPNLGSAWTTALDLARWGRALERGKVVSRASYERMTSPARLNDGRRWPYGFGIGLLPFEGHTRRRHTGRVLGFYAVLSRYPEADVTIAMLTNLGGASAIAYELEPRIAARLLGVELPPVRDLPLSPAEQRRYVGTYDGGAFWFDVVAAGERIAVVLRDPDYVADGDLHLRSDLYYQGHDAFVARDGAEWSHVRFSGGPGPAAEMALGNFAQAVRRP
jgi:CubicO group peptidase (beta-lactamase class C family)